MVASELTLRMLKHITISQQLSMTLNKKPNFCQEKLHSECHCVECPSPASYPIHLKSHVTKSSPF